MTRHVESQPQKSMISVILTRHELPCAPWDALVEDGDIFGDGVNLAARLEGLADPGGICVSGRVHADVAGKLDVAFEDMGEQQIKNISRPVRVFRAQLGAARASGKNSRSSFSISG